MSEKRKFVRAPNFSCNQSENLSPLHATGSFSILNPNEAHILFFVDRIELAPGEIPGSQKIKEINQEIQAEIHMSPITFKSMALLMNRQVQDFEKRFGEINMDIGKTETTKGPDNRGTTYV